MSEGWSIAFRSALSSGSTALAWVVRPIQLRNERTYRSDDYPLSTHPGYGSGTLMGPPSCQGSRATLGSWSSTIGGMSFDVAVDAGAAAALRGRYTVGTFVEILAGVAGWPIEEMQRVSVGRVTGIGFRRGVVTLQVGDPLTLLDSRPTHEGDACTVGGKMEENRGQTTIATAYTAGDTTLEVGSTAQFLEGEVGVEQVLVVGEFMLWWSAKTATEFTVSASGKYNTTAVDTDAGATVWEVFRVQGHPLDAVRQIIISGSGISGTGAVFDVLPDEWGLGIGADVLAHEDIGAERDEVMTVDTGGYNIDILSDVSQPQPRSWITGVLSTFGVVPALRQGQLTFRAATLSTTRRRDAVAVLTDAEIIGSEMSSEWYDQAQTEEAGSVIVRTAFGTSTSGTDTLQTLPGVDSAEVDLSLYVYQNESEISAEVADRLTDFYRRRPEVLTLPVAGLWAASLAVFDVVVVRTACPYLRFDYSGVGRECLVLQVSPDWRRNRVELRVASHPGSEVWP